MAFLTSIVSVVYCRRSRASSALALKMQRVTGKYQNIASTYRRLIVEQSMTWFWRSADENDFPFGSRGNEFGACIAGAFVCGLCRMG